MALHLRPVTPAGAPTVYLAGPISGCSYEGATDWRDHATAVLARDGIKGLSPMRAKEYLKGCERKLEHPYPVGTRVKMVEGVKVVEGFVYGQVVGHGPKGVSYYVEWEGIGVQSHMNETAVQAVLTDIGFSSTCEEYGHLSPLSGPRGIMTRDRFDATRCGVLLVNLLGATKVSVGTVMEIAWADLKRTPVVVAIEPSGNPHEHAMVTEAIGFRCASMEEALQVTAAILS